MKPSIANRSRSPARARPKRKFSPATSDLGADRPQDRVDELLRLEAPGVLGELDHERVGHAELLEELEPALERRQKLHLVSEDHPRMRIEREDRRLRPGGERCVDPRHVLDATPSKVPIATARASAVRSPGR